MCDPFASSNCSGVGLEQENTTLKRGSDPERPGNLQGPPRSECGGPEGTKNSDELFLNIAQGATNCPLEWEGSHPSRAGAQADPPTPRHCPPTSHHHWGTCYPPTHLNLSLTPNPIFPPKLFPPPVSILVSGNSILALAWQPPDSPFLPTSPASPYPTSSLPGMTSSPGFQGPNHVSLSPRPCPLGTMALTQPALTPQSLQCPPHTPGPLITQGAGLADPRSLETSLSHTVDTGHMTTGPCHVASTTGFLNVFPIIHA